MSHRAATLPSPEALRKIVRQRHLPGAPGLPPLVYMTDPQQGDVLSRIAALPSGTAVIFRHYGVPQRDRVAVEVVHQCRDQSRTVLIAGDAGLARQADGLHLPSHALARPPRLAGIGRLTVAVHSLTQLKRAHDLGADAVLLSPAFSTASHPDAPTLGVLRFAALARRSSLPVYALGGMNAVHTGRLCPAGIAGVAAISALQDCG